MKEQEILEVIKDYILTKCVGTVNEATGEKSPPSIWQKDIFNMYHNYVEGHFHFRATEIELFIEYTITDIIRNDNVYYGKYFLYKLIN